MRLLERDQNDVLHVAVVTKPMILFYFLFFLPTIFGGKKKRFVVVCIVNKNVKNKNRI